jgi:branched-chain amino acid aminotransferase
MHIMSIKVLNHEEFLSAISAQKMNPNHLLMYSSNFKGWVTDSRFMVLPLDDHMVHRGDGVFEAIKAIGNSIFLLEPHMQRMQRSAEAIGLKPAVSFSDMTDKVCEAWRYAHEQLNQSAGLLRLFLSRGQGTFSPNPYDTQGSAFHIVVTKLSSLPSEKYEKGVSVGISAQPVKPSWLATVKSCNYLPNVMLKKESVDRGLDFMIALDPEGFLTEGPTENITILDQNGFLCRPRKDYILQGCTMLRVFELAEKLVSKGIIKGIKVKDISRLDLSQAQEVMMMGTTLDVLPVTQIDGVTVGNGQAGPIARTLLAELRIDQGVVS